MTEYMGNAGVKFADGTTATLVLDNVDADSQPAAAGLFGDQITVALEEFPAEAGAELLEVNIKGRR